MVAWGCRIVGTVGLNRRRWIGRTGYALRLAGRSGEAAAAYLQAISGAGTTEKHWRVPRSPNGGPARGASPHWYYHLGICLSKLGHTDLTVEALRVACQADAGHPRWLTTLAEAEEKVGNLVGAVEALELAAALNGDNDSGLRWRLGRAYDAAGMWDTARRVLSDNVRVHPEHAPSHKLLADVLKSMKTWGGAFVDTLPVRVDGRFKASLPEAGDGEQAAPLRSTARSSLERAVSLDPVKHMWRVDLAGMRAADGDLEGAVEEYDAALRVVERSTERWVLNVKQRWQFLLERTYHQMGQGRVTDPLFDCDVTVPSSNPAGARAQPEVVPGFFDVQYTFLGMRVAGFLAAQDCDHVEIYVNGALLRSVNVSKDSFLPAFRLPITRKTIALFPHSADIEVRSPNGTLRGPGGAEKVHVTIPHGNGRLSEVLASGGKVDKKGVISGTPDEVKVRQDQYLAIYSKVRDFFEDRLGRSVFLMYGTLLGYYRDHDFIPGDDDLDACYVTDRTDPVSVKEETKDIIVELVRAGFTVSFNLRGRLFRVQLERGSNDGLHVDLRPLWFQGGKLWAHNHVCLPLAREDFLPVAEGTLRGVAVAVPRNTEAFLRGHYGEGWKVPDPGFTYYPSEVEPQVRRNLARALITVAEYKELAERIRREVGEAPTAGRFVSIGSQDLYPLEDLIT